MYDLNCFSRQLKVVWIVVVNILEYADICIVSINYYKMEYMNTSRRHCDAPDVIHHLPSNLHRKCISEQNFVQFGALEIGSIVL